MDDYIFVENDKFIPAKQAAQYLGYSTDYIGRLCREEKLIGKLVGRSWYVKEISIFSYREEISRAFLESREEQARRMSLEYRKHNKAEKIKNPARTIFTYSAAMAAILLLVGTSFVMAQNNFSGKLGGKFASLDQGSSLSSITSSVTSSFSKIAGEISNYGAAAKNTIFNLFDSTFAFGKNSVNSSIENLREVTLPAEILAELTKTSQSAIASTATGIKNVFLGTGEIIFNAGEGVIGFAKKQTGNTFSFGGKILGGSVDGVEGMSRKVSNGGKEVFSVITQIPLEMGYSIINGTQNLLSKTGEATKGISETTKEVASETFIVFGEFGNSIINIPEKVGLSIANTAVSSYKNISQINSEIFEGAVGVSNSLGNAVLSIQDDLIRTSNEARNYFRNTALNGNSDDVRKEADQIAQNESEGSIESNIPDLVEVEEIEPKVALAEKTEINQIGNEIADNQARIVADSEATADLRGLESIGENSRSDQQGSEPSSASISVPDPHESVSPISDDLLSNPRLSALDFMGEVGRDGLSQTAGVFSAIGSSIVDFSKNIIVKISELFGDNVYVYNESDSESVNPTTSPEPIVTERIVENNIVYRDTPVTNEVTNVYNTYTSGDAQTNTFDPEFLDSLDLQFDEVYDRIRRQSDSNVRRGNNDSETQDSFDGITITNGTFEGGMTGSANFSDLTVDTTTLYVDSTNNRVGIGTTTPGFTLDVAGIINADDLYVDGVLFAGGSGSGTVNSGIAGQIAFYNTSTSTVSGTSTIFLSNNNVGIGTTSPITKLDIYGTAGSADIFAISSSSNARLFTVTSAGNVRISNALSLGATTYTPGYFSVNAGGGVRSGSSGASIDFATGGGSSGNLTFTTNGGTGKHIVFSPASGGNVGVGTTTPASKLDVWGNFQVATGTNPALFVDTATGFLGFGTNAPVAKLDLAGSGSAAGLRIGGMALYNSGSSLRSTASLTVDGNLIVSGPATSTFAGAVNIGTTTTGLHSRLLIQGTDAGTTAYAFRIISSAGIDRMTVRNDGAWTSNMNLGFGGGLGINSSSNGSSLIFALGGTGSGNITLTGGGSGITRNILILPTSPGRVGIGTSTPGAFFHVASSDVGTTTALFSGFSTSQTGDILQLAKNPGATPGLVFTAEGSLGIGTTTPSAKLSVTGTAGTDLFVLASSTNNRLFTVNQSGEVGIGVAPSAGFELNTVDIQATEIRIALSGSLRLGGSTILSGTAGTANPLIFGGQATQVAISTQGGGEIMRFDATGKVGIGTTTPAAKLHISTTTEQLRVGYDQSNYFTTTVGSTGGVTFKATGSLPSFLFSRHVAFGGNIITGVADFRFQTDNISDIGASASAYRPRHVFVGTNIFAGGNLALGTSTISSRLSVYGNALLEGASRYLNFGTATGTSGYGFRDNAGAVEFKNSGGSWTGIGSGSGSSAFTIGNGFIYNATTSDSVGIGTTTPNSKLNIYGGGLQLDPGAASKPTCNSAARGRIWNTFGGAGVADTFQVCQKDAADVYAWVTK